MRSVKMGYEMDAVFDVIGLVEGDPAMGSSGHGSKTWTRRLVPPLVPEPAAVAVLVEVVLLDLVGLYRQGQRQRVRYMAPHNLAMKRLVLVAEVAV